MQVSLLSEDDPDAHYRLGRAIAQLRQEQIQIICSGMAVHNLRDLGRTMADPKTILPYTTTFDEALREAVTESSLSSSSSSSPDERQQKMAALVKRLDARSAHPTLEHLMPIYIAAGAAHDVAGERLWTHLEGSLSWAQYRFG